MDSTNSWETRLGCRLADQKEEYGNGHFVEYLDRIWHLLPSDVQPAFEALIRAKKDPLDAKQEDCKLASEERAEEIFNKYFAVKGFPKFFRCPHRSEKKGIMNFLDHVKYEGCEKALMRRERKGQIYRGKDILDYVDSINPELYYGMRLFVAPKGSRTWSELRLKSLEEFIALIQDKDTHVDLTDDFEERDPERDCWVGEHCELRIQHEDGHCLDLPDDILKRHLIHRDRKTHKKRLGARKCTICSKFKIFDHYFVYEDMEDIKFKAACKDAYFNRWSSVECALSLLKCHKFQECNCHKIGYARDSFMQVANRNFHHMSCIFSKIWSVDYGFPQLETEDGESLCRLTWYGDGEVAAYFLRNMHRIRNNEDPISWKVWNEVRLNELRNSDSNQAQLFDSKVTHELSDGMMKFVNDALDKVGDIFGEAKDAMVTCVMSFALKLVAIAASGWDYKVALLLLADFGLQFAKYFPASWKDRISGVFERLGKSFSKIRGDANGVVFTDQTAEGNVAQAGFANEFLASIIETAATVFSAIGTFAMPSPAILTKLYNYIITAGNLSRAIKFSWELISKIIVSVFDYLYQWYYGVPRISGVHQELNEELNTWFSEVKIASAGFNIKQVKTDPEYTNKVRELYASGLKLQQAMIGYKHCRTLQTAFTQHFGTVTSLFHKVVALGPEETGIRIPPFVICLQGGTATGKTTITTQIARDLLKALGVECKEVEEVVNHIYNRNWEQEYWDGYRYQEICVFDDFGQMKDSQVNPVLEWMEIIRTNNTAPFNLHMADLSEKANTKFLSPVVIFSTNLKKLTPASLSEPEAFRRRVDFCIRLERNEDLQDTGVYSKDYATFTRRDVVKDEDVVTYANYKEMMADMTETLIRHRQTKLKLQKEMREQMEEDDYIYTMDDYLREEAVDEDENLSELFREEEEQERDEDESVKSFHSARNEDSEIPKTRKTAAAGISAWLKRKTQRAETFTEANEAQGWFSGLLGGNSEPEDEEEEEEPREIYKVGLGPLAGRTVLVLKDDDLDKLVYGTVEKKSIGRLTESHYTILEELCNHQVRRTHLSLFIKKFGTKELKWAWTCDEIQDCFKGNFDGIKLVHCMTVFQETVLNPRWYTVNGRKVIGEMVRANTVGTRQLHENDAELAAFFGTFLKPKNIKAEKDVDGWFERAMRVRAAAMVKHPVLYTVLEMGILGSLFGSLLGGLLGYFIGPPPNASESGMTPISHAHEGLVLGKWAQHAHECENCGKVFTHGHIIKMTHESQTYGPHLCKACKREKNKVSYFLPELASSGDPRSRTAPVRKVENSTGKEKTTSEVASSGDPKTRTAARRVVEVGVGQAVREMFGLSKPLVENKLPEDLPMQVIEASSPEQLHDWARKQRYSAQGLKSEARFDDNGIQVQKKVLMNTYLLSVHKNGVEQFAVRGIMVKGKKMLTVSHIMAHVSDGCQFHVERTGMLRPLVFPAESCKITQLGKEGNWLDAVVIEFPKLMPDHSDITNLFARKMDHASLSDFYGVVVFNGAGDLRRFCYGRVKQNFRETFYNDNGRNMVALQSYEYSLETAAGDCGSPLFVVANQIAKKLVGIHICGSTGKGFALPITAEDLEDALDRFGHVAQSKHIEPADYECFLDEDRVDVECPEGSFLPIGKVKVAPGAATKSQLRPSIIHDEVPWESTTIPARLTPFIDGEGKIIDPLSIGLKKAGVNCTIVPERYIETAINDVQQIFGSNVDESRRRVLGDEEMIVGVEGDPYMPAVRRSTSAGYPWVLDSDGKPGKTKWLGSGEEFEFHPDLMAAIRRREELARLGIRMETVWTDTLKDERRPIIKVLDGRTRVFSAGPMDFTILFRKYFLGFCAHLEWNRIDNEVCVGTNVYSYDWQRIYDKITRFGKDQVVAGDFSNFDGTLQIDILEPMVDIVNNWYDDGIENRTVRRTLWKDIVNACHLYRDNLYYWTHGQPSGCPMTAILNSIYNSLSVRICYMALAEMNALEKANMLEFNKNVSMVSYGDDNLIGISPRIASWFNQISLADAYAAIGMIYTDESKSGELVPLRSIDEVGFLKREFRYEPLVGRQVAPLALNTIKDMCLWIRGELESFTKSAENAQSAAFEMAIHGRKQYEQFVDDLKMAFNEVGAQVHFPLWDEQIRSRLAGISTKVACDNSAEADCEINSYESGALGTIQIAEGMVRLDPSVFDELDEDSQDEEDVGALFSVDDGQPPTEIMGSHPACTRALVVHQAQGKSNWTNNDQNKPVEALSDELQKMALDVAKDQRIAANVIPEVMDRVDEKASLTQREDVSALVGRYLERPTRMATLAITGVGNQSIAYGKLSDYFNNPQVNAVVSKFAKIKGTLCARVTLTAPTNTSVAGLVKIVEAEHGVVASVQRFSNGPCQYIEAHKDSVAVLKRRIDNIQEYVPTAGTNLSNRNNLQIFLNIISLYSTVTPADVRCSIEFWMEDVVVAVPTSQGKVSFPTAGCEQANRFFNERHSNQVEESLESPTFHSLSTWTTAGEYGDLIRKITADSTSFGASTFQAKALDQTRLASFDHIKYIFKAVKTPFHKGKIRIIFGRGENNVGTSVVWDIATQDTFSIEAPYSWYGIHLPMNASEPLAQLTFRPSIRLEIEEKLQCPENAPTSVDILTFSSIHGLRIHGLRGGYTETNPFVHQAQGLLPSCVGKSVDYRIPVTSNRPEGGQTLWESMKRCLTDVMPVNIQPSAGLDNANFLIVPQRIDLFTGLIELFEHFSYWTGKLNLEVAFTNQSFKLLTADQTAVSFYMFRPFGGSVAVAHDSTFTTPTDVVHVDKELATMDGEVQIDSLPSGGMTCVEMMPMEEDCGFISAAGNFGPGSIVLTTGPGADFPSCMLRLSLGDDFQIGGPV